MIINKHQKWNDNVVYCVKKYVRKPIKTTYDKNVWVKISNGKNVKILRLWYQTMVDENIKSIMIWKVRAFLKIWPCEKWKIWKYNMNFAKYAHTLWFVLSK